MLDINYFRIEKNNNPELIRISQKARGASVLKYKFERLRVSKMRIA